MRHRTVACLLVLTVGDYLLWNWSLAGNHDILSLFAGMTLLPLAAISVGVVVLATLGLLARVARASSRMARSMRANRATDITRQQSASDSPGSPAGSPESAAASEPSSHKLAA